jgi:hypothetical protein
MKNNVNSKSVVTSKQGGSILIVSMVFLLLITLIAVSSSRLGYMELLMAGNSQAKVEATQLALGVVDSTLNNWKDNFVTDTEICGGDTSGGDCDGDLTIVLDGAMTGLFGDADVGYATEYLGEGPPLRRMECSVCTAFYFNVDVFYDDTDNRQGRSEIGQGVAILNPVSGGASGPSGDLDHFLGIPVN